MTTAAVSHGEGRGEETEGGSGVDARMEDFSRDLKLDPPAPLDPEPMARFFDALEKMTDSDEKGLVRVLHYGDSHTAADFLPSAIRRTLQRRFGDGGRGFVLLGKPWPAYGPMDVETSARGEWRTQRIIVSKEAEKMDGRYGLAGVAMEASRKGVLATVGTTRSNSFGTRASRFEIFYLKQPGGGSFTVSVDQKRRRTVKTASNRLTSGFYDVAVYEGPHKLQVKLKGDGEVRFFGAVAETDGPGIVYDALGINGAFFYTALRWDKRLLEDQMARRTPALIVTMYGANDATSRSLTEEEYLRRVRKSLALLREGAPHASCLMLGPPDRVITKPPVGDKPRLDLVIEVQQAVAAEAGCTFMDVRALMGGSGAFEKWRQKGLTQPDGVHLTVTGYRMLGELIGHQILDAYDRYHGASRPSSGKALKRTPDETSGRNER